MNKQPHQAIDDQALLDRYLRTGDKTWLGYLLDRYSPLLYGISMKYLGDSQAAEDAVSQVFLQVLSLADLQGIRDFRAWLMVVMKNYCLKWLRDHKKTWETLTLDHEELRDPDPSPGMAPYMLDGEEAPAPEELLAILEGLPAVQATCLRLFYLEKSSYMDIVRRTDYDFRTVKSAIQNGRRNLKIRWQKNREGKT